MPVGTQGTVKGVTPQQLLDEVDPPIILSNTYHLYLRPGHETVRELRRAPPIHELAAAILTDSGGFQVFSLTELRKITRGRRAVPVAPRREPRTCSRPNRRWTFSSRSVAISAMVLDECMPYPATDRGSASSPPTGPFVGRDAAFDRCRERRNTDGTRAVSDRPGRRCTRNCGARVQPSCSSWTRPVTRSAACSVGEPRDLSLEMVEVTAPLLPRDRPRYVMGVGMPDGAARVRRARRGHDGLRAAVTRTPATDRLYTSAGRLVIKHAVSRGRPAPGGSELRLLHMPQLSAEPTSGICFSPARCCTRHWRQSTTYAVTLTSCARCERLFCQGDSPNILNVVRSGCCRRAVGRASPPRRTCRNRSM